MADHLGMPLREIDLLTVDEFDDAVEYLQRKAGGDNR